MIDQQRNPRFDVASLGETMLRQSVLTGERLDDARGLDVERLAARKAMFAWRWHGWAGAMAG